MRKEPANKDYCLVFYHIEKTAGTTFNEILMREYQDDHLYHLYGSRRRDDIERFKKMSGSERGQIHCVTGHMSHLLVPYILKPVRYITFLRDPLMQVASSYHYQNKVKRTKGYEKVKDINSIEEYLDWQIENRRDNIQTRYLADAVRFLERDTGQIDMQKNGDKYLKKAIDRLNEIELVFITEEFNKAILAMQSELNWRRTPYYSRLNKSPNRKPISEDAKKQIQEIHRFDFELYRHAKKRHDEIINRQKDLPERLEKFEKWNGMNAFVINRAKDIRNYFPGGKGLMKIISKTRDAIF